jgi:hypothetical protein
MKSRCFNPNHPRFEDYGGRGITVCEEWLSFEAFFADMGLRPPGCSLDRRDVNGNYEPSNCKWSTREEQAYATLVRAYGLRDAASLAILTEALTSLKIARECHEQLAKDGRTYRVADQPRVHPLCAIERDARSAFLVGMKTLNLELPKTATGAFA